MRAIRFSPSARSGFTLIEIMIVVAIIGMLLGVAIPSINTARKKAAETACINNLRSIQGTKAMWALTNKKGDNDVPTEADLALEQKVSCPGGGTYNFGSVGTPATCSIPGHALPAVGQ